MYLNSFYLDSQCNVIREDPGNSSVNLEFSCLFLLCVSTLMADVGGCKAPTVDFVY